MSAGTSTHTSTLRSAPVARNASLRVGIVNAPMNVQRHNTDHACVIDFAAIQERDPSVSIGFIPNVWQSILTNVNFAVSRADKRRTRFQIGIELKRIRADVLYQYGVNLRGLRLPTHRKAPLLITAAYPVQRADLARSSDELRHLASEVLRTTERADVLHFHTSTMRRLYLENVRGERRTCVSIPFFLPHLRIADASGIASKFQRSSIQFLFVGYNGMDKGIDTVCAALDRIAGELHRHNVHATFVSRSKPSLSAFRNVRYEPELPRAEVQALMADAHIYCLVPRRESFGITFVEAMASGCAVIGDDDLPRHEIFDGGRCGRLIRKGDWQALADTLVELITDRTSMAELAMRGRERAATTYAPDVVAGQYTRLFHQMTLGGAHEVHAP